MGSVEGWPRWSFRPSSPRTPAGPSAVAKPPDNLQLLPTLTRVQSLKSSSLGGKKTEVPPPARRVVTSPYRQPVAGVAAHHVIHAPPNPARALPPPHQTPTSPASSPQLSPSLLPHCCQQSQLRLPLASAPPPTATLRAPVLRSLLLERGVPPLKPCPQIQALRVRGPRGCSGGGDNSSPLIPPTVD